MKRLLYSVCLFFLVIACRSDIFPNDLLYQRWEFVQTRQGNGPWSAFYKTMTSDTEYRSDGSLIYRYNGKVVPGCCQPSRFTRHQNEIEYSEYTPCALSLCDGPSSNPPVTITQLTASLLELTNGQTISQYKSAK